MSITQKDQEHLEEVLLTLGNQVSIMASYIEKLEEYIRLLEKKGVTTDVNFFMKTSNIKEDIKIFQKLYKQKED